MKSQDVLDLLLVPKRCQCLDSSRTFDFVISSSLEFPIQSQPFTKETHCNKKAKTKNKTKQKSRRRVAINGEQGFRGKFHQWLSGKTLNKGILPGNWSQLSKCIHYARFSHIYSDSSFILCTPVSCDATACFDGAYSLGLSESGVTVWHVFFFHFLFRTSAVDVRRWLKCEKERCSERQKKLCRASTVAHQEHPRGGSMELASVSVLQCSCWVGVIVGWWETANESPIPIVFSSFCSVSQRVSALYREASYNSMLSWRRPRPRHWYAFQQSLAAMEQMYTCALSL